MFLMVAQAVMVQTEIEEGPEISTKLYVEGICCPSEVPLIEAILTKLPGVSKVGRCTYSTYIQSYMYVCDTQNEMVWDFLLLKMQSSTVCQQKAAKSVIRLLLSVFFPGPGHLSACFANLLQTSACACACDPE